MKLRSALLLATFLAPAPLSAQVERNIPMRPYAVDESYLTGLKWRNIGPNRGGRSIAVAGSTARPNEYYFGAVGGGLWKTTDGGASWKPMTDKTSTIVPSAESPSARPIRTWSISRPARPSFAATS